MQMGVRGGMIKSVQKIESYRHVLNTDSGGGQMQMGVRGGRIKSVQKIETYRHVLNTDLDGGGVRCRWGFGGEE